MRKFNIIAEIQEYDSTDELSSSDTELMAAARKSMGNAYAPYSNFKVGAALALNNGKTISGNNQENVAYPSGLCAERVAIFAASAQYPDAVVETVAVIASSDEFEVENPVSPCGACRQVLSEYETRQGSNIRVLLSGNSGKIWELDSIAAILPMAFTRASLKLNPQSR